MLIEWEARPEDGKIPYKTYVSNEELKLYDPAFLIDFYESKIIVVSKKEDNGGVQA
jgi:hypothetical protein